MIHTKFFGYDAIEEGSSGLQGRYLLTMPSKSQWTLNLLDMGGVQMALGHDGAGGIYEGISATGKFSLCVPLSRIDSVAINGRRCDPENIAWLASSQELNIPSSTANRWLRIVVEAKEVERWIQLPTHPLDCAYLTSQYGRSDPGATQSAAALITRAMHVASSAPEQLAPKLAQESLRQQILDAALAVLRSMEHRPESHLGRPRLSRKSVLANALAFITSRIDDTLHVDELCIAAGVSERTLHGIFREQFGVTPHRYLMLKRMHSVHSALRRAQPSETIAAICGQFGIWDFGRFASQYRKLFGVYPSQTLANGRQF